MAALHPTEQPDQGTEEQSGSDLREVRTQATRAHSVIDPPPVPPEHEEYEGDEDEPRLEPFDHPEFGPVLRDPTTGEIYRGDQPPEEEDEEPQLDDDPEADYAWE